MYNAGALNDMASADDAPLHELIKAALIIVGRNQQTVVGDEESAVPLEVPGGADIEIRFAGPDIPTDIPTDLADDAVIRKTGEWKATYGLSLWAPLVVLDVCWNEGEPVILHTYSRGDWKEDLLSAATSPAE